MNPTMAAAFVTVLSDGAWNDAETVNTLALQTLADDGTDVLDQFDDDRAISVALRRTRTWMIREGLLEFDATTGDIRVVDTEDATDAIATLLEDSNDHSNDPATPEAAVLPSGKQAFYDIEVEGVSEDEIWGYAPTVTMDRLGFTLTTPKESVQQIMDMLPMTTFTRQYSDHRSRIWVPQGQGKEARALVEAWASANNIDLTRMRVDESVSFRNIAQIPSHLVGGLVQQAVDVVLGTARGHNICRGFRNLAERRISDVSEDVRSALILFAYDLLDRFDDARGATGKTNFTTFVYGKSANWVYDLERRSYGREILDTRRKMVEASDELIARGEDPTQSMLNSHIDAGDGSFAERMRVFLTLLNIRDAAVIGGEAQMHIQFNEPGGPSSDDVFDLPTAHELSRAVSSACVTYGENGKVRTDGVALMSTYLSTWGGMTKREVAKVLSVREHTVGAGIRRVVAKAQDNEALLDVLG